MRVAIWGAGKMGWVHAKAYKRLMPGVEIAAVIEANEEKAGKFSKEFQCKKYGRITELSEGETDAVDICLPTHEHGEAILQALGQCAYVLCEKPICLYEDEFRELKQAAIARGGFVMVGQVLRFWNGYKKIKELVESGVIGNPRFITCTRRQKLPEWSNGNWLMDLQKSGGLMMDLCIHDVDYINWLLGKPSRVSCETVNGSDGTGLHSIIIMVYDTCCAQVIGSWGMPSGFNSGELSAGLEIVGDLGMLTYHGGNHIQIITGEEKKELLLEDGDGYEQEICYFSECIKENKAPILADIEAVEGTMKILWAAKQAQETGKVVSLQETAHSSS